MLNKQRITPFAKNYLTNKFLFKTLKTSLLIMAMSNKSPGVYKGL